MSTYSDISKEIGWEGRKVAMPTLEEAKNLYVKIKEHKDQDAFKQVFFYWRFGDLEQSDSDLIKVVEVLGNAFSEGEKHFR